MGGQPSSPGVDLDWAERIQRVLDDASLLRPAFQPIIDLNRGVIAGYEMLSRFEDPIGHSPAAWFEAAERLGLVAELDALVVSAGLDELARLPDNTFLTLNLTACGIVSEPVRRALSARERLEPLVVELTEQFEGSAEGITAAVADLRRRGAMLAIDDVGAGYGSLQRIMELRPQFLKVDRSLVQGVHRDEAKAAAVEMLGTLADRIDAWLVVEGLETDSELARMSQMKVPLAQGFLLARPSPDLAVTIATTVETQPTALGELAGLVEPVASIGADEVFAAPRLFAADPDLLYMVVTGAEGPPLALLGRPFAGMRPRRLAPMLSNSATRPSDLVRRAMTRSPVDRFAPVIHCDDRGRVEGIITLERLIERFFPD